MNDFETLLRHRLRRAVEGVRGPSPRAAQARYRQQTRSIPAFSKLAVVMVGGGLALTGSIMASAAAGGPPAQLAQTVQHAVQHCTGSGLSSVEHCVGAPPGQDATGSAAGRGGGTVGKPGLGPRLVQTQTAAPAIERRGDRGDSGASTLTPSNNTVVQSPAPSSSQGHAASSARTNTPPPTVSPTASPTRSPTSSESPGSRS